MSSDIYGSQFESILQSLEQMETALQKEIDKDEKANREAAEKQAEAARRGELGEDWRKVQERIDSGQTTLEDVFSGADQSDAAHALRQTSQRNITKSIEQARKSAPEGEDPFSFDEDLASFNEQIEQHIRNLRGY
jgi:hypothetical protein